MTRSAFTITEVLVSITVIGLLMALIMPAVQSARASARLTECRDHLKQIGVAIHVVHDARQRFSSDYDVLYHFGMGVPGYARGTSSRLGPVFQCPADPHSDIADSTHSYWMSTGTWNGVGSFYFNHPSHSRNGEAYRQAAEFTDGLSNTTAFSESAILNMADQIAAQDDPKKYALWISTLMTTSNTAQEFLNACRSPGNSALPLLVPLRDGYTHLLTPNTRGCWNSPPGSAPTLTAFMPANSYHPGGVSVLFVDGHVTFVSDSIDSKVWEAIGTISGNEAVSAPF